MGLLLLILAALLADAQTVVSLSPAGDGAGLTPLLKLRFSAPIDPEALRSRVWIRWGASAQTAGFTTYPIGYAMPINEVSWDPATNTLYAKPDEQLDHDRDYELVVSGPGDTTLATSRFHTRNITSTLLARELGPAASVTRVIPRVLDLTEVKAITVLNQTSANPAVALTSQPFPVDPSFITSLGLRRLVFLRYTSPRGDSVDVHAWIPNAPKPIGGYPVTLIGHGFGDSRLYGPSFLATSVIANSVVMAIDAVGHGYGPGSQLRFDLLDGTTLNVPFPGRGRDVDGDGKIDAGEGCVLLAPRNPDFSNSCFRETALDYRKLVREIQWGIDLDGDGANDLDANRIRYIGQSYGAMYGTILVAVEGGIEAAVLNVGGGSSLELFRYGSSARPQLQAFVAASMPELVGVPDPLIGRWQPVVRFTNPRSGAYLEYIDSIATIAADANPASFAPFLKQATLYGNPIKRVLFQYAVGDQTVANPTTGQLLRAAFEYELVSVYRHDLARAEAPELPENPHTFLAAFAAFDQPQALIIGLAGLTQAGQFLASGKREVPDVNSLVRLVFKQNLFEVPALFP